MYTIVLPDISDIRYQILQLYIQHAYLYIQYALPADWRYCMLSSTRRVLYGRIQYAGVKLRAHWRTLYGRIQYAGVKIV